MDAVWLRLNQIIAEMDSLEMPLNEGGSVQFICNPCVIQQAYAQGLITDN